MKWFKERDFEVMFGIFKGWTYSKSISQIEPSCSDDFGSYKKR